MTSNRERYAIYCNLLTFSVSNRRQLLLRARVLTDNVAERSEPLLNLVDGPHTDVVDAEQLHVREHENITDGVQSLALQAVVRPYRQVQLLNACVD